VTEQFKTASGLILGDSEVAGNLPRTVSVIVLALVLGSIALLTTRRDRLRGALRD
jgi:hypothetical protein